MVNKNNVKNKVKNGGGTCFGKETSATKRVPSFDEGDTSTPRFTNFVRSHVKYMNNLTTAQMKSIHRWALTGGLHSVNWVSTTRMQGIGIVQKDVLETYLYPFLEAIYNAPPLPHRKTLFRGINLDYIPATGTIIRHRLQPFSTTISPSIMYMFSKVVKSSRTECIQFEIQADVNVSGLYLDSKYANGRVSPHQTAIAWEGNDEYEFVMGYVDLIVKEVKIDVSANRYLTNPVIYKPCYRIVCDIKPTDIYLVKRESQGIETIYIVAPSHCHEGQYERITKGALAVIPLVINGVLQKLPAEHLLTTNRSK